jgi:hypothetical protein
MSQKVFSAVLLSFWALLGLPPALTWGDFILHFTDGGQVTVHRYVEEEQVIKIYTPRGTISFRKESVARITAVDSGQSMSTPVEALVDGSPPAATTARPGPAEGQPKTNSDKTANAGGREATRTTTPATTTKERLEKKYQEVEQEFNTLWEKHMRDIDSGAPAETLAENRRQLNHLSEEQQKLVDAARRATPESLPPWAQ